MWRGLRLVRLVLGGKGIAEGDPGLHEVRIELGRLAEISPCHVILADSVVVATDTVPRDGELGVRVHQVVSAVVERCLLPELHHDAQVDREHRWVKLVPREEALGELITPRELGAVKQMLRSRRAEVDALFELAVLLERAEDLLGFLRSAVFLEAARVEPLEPLFVRAELEGHE